MKKFLATMNGGYIRKSSINNVGIEEVTQHIRGKDVTHYIVRAGYEAVAKFSTREAASIRLDELMEELERDS